MGNNNYVRVGDIIEQERLKRQAQIAKGVNSDVYDHIEKAHKDDLSKGVEMTDNLSRFADDVDNLSKAETELLLSKLQRQIVADPESSLLKSFKSIAVEHLNDIEKAVYADNAKNRKLGRVGQEYGGKGSRGGKTDEENGGHIKGKKEDGNAQKKWFIKKLESEGADKDTSRFMSKNESYFKDVLKKYGLKSFDDFEAWGEDGACGDWDTYDKIFMQCINKIPASNFVVKKAEDDDGIEKAVYADNALNRKLGRVGQEYGGKGSRGGKTDEWRDNKKHQETNSKKDKVSEKDGSALMGKLMEAWELDSNHSFGERKKWENKLVETLNKMGKSEKWFNENAEVIANVDTGEYDDELEKLYNVNGIDDLFSLVREIGDDTENELVADSSSDIGNRIISALKADQGGLNNSSAGKKAQMKIVAAAENFMKKNPKVKLSNEDLENIVGGDIDEVEEKYGELKGWNKLNDAIELYFDAD